MLFIVSLCLMIVYCSLSVACFVKYRRFLDPFMKSNIIAYIFAFLAKPIFWFASLKLEEYNSVPARDGKTKLLIPIRSSIGGMVSGICFLIIHIFQFRIVIAYYLLKLQTDSEKQILARKITLFMYVHVAIYVVLVLLQSVLEFLNGQRLDSSYHAACQLIHLGAGEEDSWSDKCKAAINVDYDPNWGILVPDLIIDGAKLCMDLFVLICGLVFFYRFRSLKKVLDQQIQARQRKLG